jgi:ABC-type sugar transport system permease subunit
MSSSGQAGRLPVVTGERPAARPAFRSPAWLRPGTGAGRRRGSARAGWILTLPAIVAAVALLVVPIGQSFYYSMTSWNGITSSWIGPSAYTQLFADPTFQRVLENNGLLLLAMPVVIAIPLGIAFLLHEQVWGWKFFRSAVFLPTAISWVVIGVIAVRFYALHGMLNSMLSAIGLGFIKTNMLGSTHQALAALAITLVWSQLGTNTIIFITGLATLDPSLAEAARVDGAGPLRVYRKVIMPQLTRFIQFAFIITVLTAFTAIFSLIFVMTGGGPDYGSTTLEFYVYQQAFSQSAFGTGALLGVLLFVLVAGISIIQVRVLRVKT